MFDELIAILDQLDTVYQRLLAQADRERSVLIRADLTALRQLNREKQQLADQAEALEVARCKTVGELSARLPNRPTTVAGLAEAASPEQAKRLRQTAARLKETVAKLQAANTAGMDLIGHSLKVVRGTLQLLGVYPRPGIYARTGQAPPRSGGRILSAEA